MGIGSGGNYGSYQAASNAAFEAAIGKSLEAAIGEIDDDYEFTYEGGSYNKQKKKKKKKKG